MSALKSWGRLLRLSLAPTAIADVVAGAFWGGAGGAPPLGELALLGLASSCTYHGGMALNDWADRAQDARVRPDRPVPSGGVNARAALIVALAGIGARMEAPGVFRIGGKPLGFDQVSVLVSSRETEIETWVDSIANSR